MDYHHLTMLGKLAQESVRGRIRELGLTDTEHQLCTFLYFHDGVTQDAASLGLMIDKTTVAKVLLGLERKGLVHRRRDEANRRRNRVGITEAGRARVRSSVHVHQEWLERAASVLTAQERASLDALFGKLLQGALDARKADGGGDP